VTKTPDFVYLEMPTGGSGFGANVNGHNDQSTTRGGDPFSVVYYRHGSTRGCVRREAKPPQVVVP